MTVITKKEPLLFLCHRIPFPPNKGDKIRSFNLLKKLRKFEKLKVYNLKKDIKILNDIIQKKIDLGLVGAISTTNDKAGTGRGKKKTARRAIKSRDKVTRADSNKTEKAKVKKKAKKAKKRPGKNARKAKKTQ